jgi:hypothetical protein
MSSLGFRIFKVLALQNISIRPTLRDHQHLYRRASSKRWCLRLMGNILFFLKHYKSRSVMDWPCLLWLCWIVDYSIFWTTLWLWSGNFGRQVYTCSVWFHRLAGWTVYFVSAIDFGLCAAVDWLRSYFAHIATLWALLIRTPEMYHID